jgi:hypothetical protein
MIITMFGRCARTFATTVVVASPAAAVVTVDAGLGNTSHPTRTTMMSRSSVSVATRAARERPSCLPSDGGEFAARRPCECSNLA